MPLWTEHARAPSRVGSTVPLHQEHRQTQNGDQPDTDDQRTDNPVCAWSKVIPCFGSAVSHQFLRNHLDDQHDAQRNDDQIIQIAQYRYEIGYQIEWAQCICCHCKGNGLGIPGRPRVTACKLDRHNIQLETKSPRFHFFEHDKYRRTVAS